MNASGRLHSVPFLLGFSTVFLLALHGTSVVKIFGVLATNYSISKYFRGSRLNPLLTWIFNGTVLFTSELYSGYHFGSLHAALGALVGIGVHLPVAPLSSAAYLGCLARNIPTVVHHLQHHHVTIDIFQYGLLLGVFAQAPCGRRMYIDSWDMAELKCVAILRQESPSRISNAPTQHIRSSYTHSLTILPT